MKLNELPDTLLLGINEYLFTDDYYYSIQNLKRRARDIYRFSIVSKIPQNLSSIKKQIYLLNKYYKYNDDYEWYYYNFHLKNKIKDILPHPILVDILFSGCYLPYALHSQPYFTFKDLKECIQLFPNSIHSDFGRLRCQYNIKPIHAACINTHIPISTIKYLIENGSDINSKILINNEYIHILDIVEYNSYPYSYSRDVRIRDLLVSYIE